MTTKKIGITGTHGPGKTTKAKELSDHFADVRMSNKCSKCGAPLVAGENITQNSIDHSRHVCKSCKVKQNREREHRTGKHKPMCENRECPSFLGVHVAERVLSHLFKNVIRMPYGNPGYDFVCNSGYLVDAKCSCRNHRKAKADNWIFHIRKNHIANYFLCLAFDSRDDLTPEHVWMIPASDVNDNVGVSISETTLDKWQQYEQPVDRVIACCDVIRGITTC